MSERDVLERPAAELVAADVARAFAEDLDAGDPTAELLPANARAHAVLTCRDDAVLAGQPWFDACFRARDPAIEIHWRAADGAHVAAGSTICTLAGQARALVSAERSALNFLQLLSGTATTTAAYVARVAGTSARILDTRKTLPGLRIAQKYAVRCGGGHNHRMGLYDAMLIKENHIIAAGGIAPAIRAARRLHPRLPLEVEVETLDELAVALAEAPDRIMLDNFTPGTMRAAVAKTGGRVPLEASGNITLDTIAEYAHTGVDYISIGALTKHVHAVDLSLRLTLA